MIQWCLSKTNLLPIKVSLSLLSWLNTKIESLQQEVIFSINSSDYKFCKILDTLKGQGKEAIWIYYGQSGQGGRDLLYITLQKTLKYSKSLHKPEVDLGIHNFAWVSSFLN